MGDLTKNFSRSEWRCKCGKCHYEAVDFELVTVMQNELDIESDIHGLELKCKITSGNRCPDHNLKVTKNPDSNSKHMYALANDFYYFYYQKGAKKRLDMRSVFDRISEKYDSRYGIAYYHNNGRNRIHLDVATIRRPWRHKYMK